MKEQYPDKTDKTMLNILEQDGRISYSSLGESVGLSKTPCWNRVKELEKSGAIKGYAAQVDPAHLGLHIHALVHVVVNFDQYEAFEQAIIEHPHVRACHAVTGDFDYVLEVLTTDMKAFDELLRANFSRLPGVDRFKTSISTRMVKSQGPYSKMI